MKSPTTNRRHEESSGGGLSFWGFCLALIAVALILNIALPPATTTPTHTHPAPTTTTTAPPPTTTTTAPPPTFGSGGRDLPPKGDSYQDKARQLSECMVTTPIGGPLLCLGKAVD